MKGTAAAPGGKDTGTLGMAVLLASLSMLFVASLVGFLLIRSRATVWGPPGGPGLPSGLWISTMLLLASGAALELGRARLRAGRQRAFRRALAATWLLGVAFLASQILNAFALAARGVTARSGLYGFTFYLLTGLHALHVLGGLVPLAIVTGHAQAGRYSPEVHPGVRYCAIYWHFLDAVWLVLFVLLLALD
jgi:cytochrome c oxidase subunit 3